MFHHTLQPGRYNLMFAILDVNRNFVCYATPFINLADLKSILDTTRSRGYKTTAESLIKGCYGSLDRFTQFARVLNQQEIGRN